MSDFPEVKVLMQLESETRNTWRYREIDRDNDDGLLDTTLGYLYLNKEVCKKHFGEKPQALHVVLHEYRTQNGG